MIAPIDKIKSLLSEEIVTLFGDDVIDNSYDEAMKFVLSILSSKTLITELSTHFGETTNRWYATDSANIVLNKFLKNRRILKVEREHTADTDVYYEATELNFLNYEKFTNSSSIHYENNIYRPKWYGNASGHLKLIPSAVTDFKVYYITFPKMGSSGGYSDGLFQTHHLHGKTFSTIVSEGQINDIFIGIPDDARELVYVQIALNLIQNYLADFVHEEEDEEMVTLLSQHTASLNASKKDNLQYVANKYGMGVKKGE